MPDDERRGGTHSSTGDSNGYGRRHRRADEPTEQPRRRRRSMEDGPGGLSVADLVQRHSTSRQDLSAVSPPPGRRNPPPANQPPRRPVEGQGNGRPNGRRPGETAAGPQWPDQTAGQGRRAAAQPPTGHHAFPEDPAGHPPAPGPGGFPPDRGTPVAGRRGMPPGQASGYRALPAERPTPGPATGRRALPDAPPPNPAGGRRGTPDVPPPGQASGRRALPNDLAGGRAPGQHTGRRAFPEDPAGRQPAASPGGFPADPAGPGQASVRRPVPPPNGRQAPPSRPQTGPPAAGGPADYQPPGPHPRDGRPAPGQSSRHPSVPVPDDRPSNPGRPGAVPIAEEPAGPPVPRGQAGPGSKPRMTPSVPLPPPRPPTEDAISMTAEMEAIGEDVQKRRSIDHTLARFSAVHDELKAEERERKSKRRKLMPWQHEDEELDRLDELVGMPSIAGPPNAAPEPEPADVAAPAGATRLQEKKSRRRNKSALAVRVFAATAAILVFVATGIAWGLKAWVDASSNQVDALDPDSAAIQDVAKQRGDENFLLVGSDTRAGAAAEEGVGSAKDIVGARSDTVMVAHIPADRQRVVVVSFPRDLEVTRPECEGWDPKTGDYTGERKPAAEQVKLNSAYQVGGPLCVTKLVQQLSGLKINHFVGIDFHGFKDMVDAVRGVQVCVERPLKDDILGTVVPVAGKQVTLSGDQALNFVRARHVQGDLTSDYGRIKRQQRFLSSLLRKAMSTDVLLDPGKLTGFVNAFAKSTFGDNIGVDQMMVLGQSMQGIEAGRVTFITVPTVGEANENGNEDLRVAENNALFSAIRNDSPLPGETPAKTPAQAGLRQEPVDPSKIKLQVLNGGNPTNGIAGDTADELAELGFKIVWVGTAPDEVDRTIIKFGKEGAAAAATAKAAVPSAELVEDPSMGSAVQVIVGPGFDREVVTPKGAAAPPPKLPSNLSTINAGDVSCA